MAKRTTKYSLLPESSRGRIRQYVWMFYTTPSTDLAIDLGLPVTTVAAIKANLKRE